MDLVLNNLQRLICHKTPTNQPTNQKGDTSLNPNKQKKGEYKSPVSLFTQPLRSGKIWHKVNF